MQLAAALLLATYVMAQAPKDKPAPPTATPAATSAPALTDVQNAQQSVLELSSALAARDARIGQLEVEVGQLRQQLAKAQADRLQPIVQKFVEDAAKTLGGEPGDYDPTTRALKKKP